MPQPNRMSPHKLSNIDIQQASLIVFVIATPIAIFAEGWFWPSLSFFAGAVFAMTVYKDI